LNKEHSKSTREEKEKTKEPCQEELETSRNVQNVEVSVITPPVVLVALSNQSILSYQGTQSTSKSGSMHTQYRTRGRSMEDEMWLPTFRRDGSEDPDHHWFLCEVVSSIKNVIDKVVKRDQFINTLRYRALSWYMKFVQGVIQPKPLNDIKTVLIAKFKKP
jgi:hypothetical protein